MVKYVIWCPGEALFISIAWLCSFLLLFDASRHVIGLALIMGFPVMLLLRDARGVVTLRGVLEWRTMNELTIFVFAFVMMLLFPVTLTIYLLIACADYRVMTQHEDHDALKRVFAQRVITSITTINKSDTTKSA